MVQTCSCVRINSTAIPPSMKIVRHLSCAISFRLMRNNMSFLVGSESLGMGEVVKFCPRSCTALSKIMEAISLQLLC